MLNIQMIALIRPSVKVIPMHRFVFVGAKLRTTYERIVRNYKFLYISFISATLFATASLICEGWRTISSFPKDESSRISS